jgi:DNA polymerase III delta prime subunit
MNPTLSFVDKYKPLELEKMVGNKQTIQKLCLWLDLWIKPKDIKTSNSVCGLLYGPPGIGKTLCIELLCKKKDYNPLFLHSEEKEKDLESLIKTPTSFCGKKNILIIEDLDGITDFPLLHECMKKTYIPILATCNQKYHPSMKTIVSYCTDFPFYKPQSHDILAFLTPIVQAENISISQNNLKKCIEESFQDIRSCLHYLQLISFGKTPVTFGKTPVTFGKTPVTFGKTPVTFGKTPVTFGKTPVTFGSFGKKDRVVTNLFDVTQSILSQTIGFKEKGELYDFHAEILPLMVHQNYIATNLTMKNEVDTFMNLSQACDSLCDADILYEPYTSCSVIRATENCQSNAKIVFTEYFAKHSRRKSGKFEYDKESIKKKEKVVQKVEKVEKVEKVKKEKVEKVKKEKVEKVKKEKVEKVKKEKVEKVEKVKKEKVKKEKDNKEKPKKQLLIIEEDEDEII